MSLPPDLRILCQTLTSTSPGELINFCPVLVSQVLRCGGPLSAPSEPKSKDNPSESSMLVHRLKLQTNTFLHGKTPSGRFIGIVLTKAIIDVGGWECLRTCESWVQGLLAVLQKPDPPLAKELCIVTLSRIFTLLHGYQTLVREIATPRLTAFASACLQLLKTPAPGRPLKVPLSLVETVISAISAIIPLYPTTLRPIVSQIRGVLRPYLAPTASDGTIVPHTLRDCARRLTSLLHYTTPKNGNADEWAKTLDTFVKHAHQTADQIFRAIQEPWDSSSRPSNGAVSSEGEPQGGGDSADELPVWTGLRSGAQRLIGILESMTMLFLCSTKSPVAFPLGTISEMVSRLTMVLPPSSQSLSRESHAKINPSIGRDEREELWSVLPDIHVAVMNMGSALVKRLGANSTPLAPSILDQAIRVFKPSYSLSEIRQSSYTLIKDVLLLMGPSIQKLTVDSLDSMIQACCRDLLQATRFLNDDGPMGVTIQNGSKSKAAAANTDVFPSKRGSLMASNRSQLEPRHLRTAEDLLEVLLSHLPQQHIKKAERAVMDRTAILTCNKKAMVSSVLHPFVDKAGRHFANTLPFLAQAYPQDSNIEVLRSNLRTKVHHFGDVLGENAMEPDHGGPSSDSAQAPIAPTVPQWQTAEGSDSQDGANSRTRPFGSYADDSRMERTPFAMNSSSTSALERESDPVTFEPLILKRKNDDVTESAPKRVDKGKAPEVDMVGDVIVAASESEADMNLVRDVIVAANNGESDSDSEGSVHLQAVFDDEEYEDDEDEDMGD